MCGNRGVLLEGFMKPSHRRENFPSAIPPVRNVERYCKEGGGGICKSLISWVSRGLHASEIVRIVYTILFSYMDVALSSKATYSEPTRSEELRFAIPATVEY